MSAAVGGTLDGQRGSGCSVTLGACGAVDGNHGGSEPSGKANVLESAAHAGELMDISINATIHVIPGLMVCSPHVDDRETMPKEKPAGIGQLADTA